MGTNPPNKTRPVHSLGRNHRGRDVVQSLDHGCFRFTADGGITTSDRSESARRRGQTSHPPPFNHTFSSPPIPRRRSPAHRPDTGPVSVAHHLRTNGSFDVFRLPGVGRGTDRRDSTWGCRRIGPVDLHNRPYRGTVVPTFRASAGRSTKRYVVAERIPPITARTLRLTMNPPRPASVSPFSASSRVMGSCHRNKL
jgi:hypothetical protein